MTEYAIYFDSSKCTGCRGCQVACKTWNELPSPIYSDEVEFKGTYQNPPDINENTRRIVTFREKKRDGSRYFIDWAFGQRACQHCTDAECVKVCPSGCLQHDETGFVTFDRDKCIGCQYCRSACPYDVPRHTGIGISGADIKINKCTGCPDRIAHDMEPACVHTCQPGALQFGPRDEMLERAEKRVEWLKQKGFDKARVYGKDEMGGLHCIAALKYDISMYPSYVEHPEGNVLTAVENVAKPLAGVAAVGVAAGLGISYLTGRGYKRDQMYYDEKTHDEVDVDTGEVVRHIDKEAGER